MGIQSNIWKLQADRFLANCWFFAPILVPFYDANGLGASDVFLIQSVFAFALASLEIPTGYLSDIVGRKKTLIIGALFIPCGICVYALSHGLWGFLLAEVFIAIGLSLRSGTETAILYDTLLETKNENEHKRIEGKAFFFQQLGSSLANVAGGLISTLSLRLVFIVNTLSSLLLLPLALSMTEPKKEHQETQKLRAHASDMIKAIKYCGSHRIIRYTSLYFTLINGVSIVGYWSYYLFYTEIDVPIASFGFIAATGSIIAGIGSKAAHFVEKKLGERVALGLPLLTIPSYFLIGFMNSLWALPLIFLNAFLWGFSIPLLRDSLHKHTPSKIRATVLSVASMGGRVLFVVVSMITGKIVDATNIQTGFMFLSFVLLVGLGLPAWKLIRPKNV